MGVEKRERRQIPNGGGLLLRTSEKDARKPKPKLIARPRTRGKKGGLEGSKKKGDFHL